MRNRALGTLFQLALVGWIALVTPGCGSSEETAVAVGGETPVETARADAPDEAPDAPPAPAARKPHERPLPAFGGVTLQDGRVSTSDLIGKRFVLFLFNPDVDVAAAAAEAMAGVAPLRGEHNFEILGIATGARRPVSQDFVKAHGLEFPVLDDSTARIASSLRAPVPVLIAAVDAEGYVTQTMGWPEKSGIEADAVEASVREMLRLPELPTPTHPVLGTHPKAPEVSGTDLDGQAFQLSANRGQAVLLIFFLHTCPHCHEAMEFLKTALAKLPEGQRPRLVGISVVDRAYAVRERLKEDGLDFFPVLMDPDGEIRKAYGATSGVPDLVLVDAEGRIAYRSHGWNDERDAALWQMHLAKAGGAPVPMLLHKTGYSGDEFCAACHELEDVTHRFTAHAYAFDTLVRHGADRDPECVSCHVVGFGKKGGYAFDRPSRHLEGVGCESCHGRGGPHLSPEFVKNQDYEPRCVVCHDEKHSLGFDYATFRPKISHKENADVLSLPLEEKLARVEALGATRKAIMPSDAAFVGSDACQSCHPKEFETWAAGGHARAGTTLARKGEGRNADCLACHTTGFGEEGGFPKGATLASHPDLGRVGCESCHGAGGDHVGQDAPKIGTILSLGDKCDSCVILQICGGCHDDANDPGFEFEVQEKIDQQRHGTIEPGTGKPKTAAHGARGLHRRADDASSRLPDVARIGALQRAFSTGAPAPGEAPAAEPAG